MKKPILVDFLTFDGLAVQINLAFKSKCKYKQVRKGCCPKREW